MLTPPPYLSARYPATVYLALAVLNSQITQWLIDASPLIGKVASQDERSPTTDELEVIGAIASQLNFWVTTNAHTHKDTVKGLNTEHLHAVTWAGALQSRQDIPQLICDLRDAIEGAPR